MSDSDLRIPASSLISFARAAFERLGLEPGDARMAAEILIDANLMGLDTHGIAHIDSHTGYAPGLESGVVGARPRIKVLRETPATALADAQGGFGLIVAAQAMDLAIAKARQLGIGAVALRNSRHCGAMGFYAKRAVDAGMLGIAMTNASPWVVPTNAKTKMIGTNPIAIGAPVLHGYPFLADETTSTIAMGKVETATRLKHALLPGWALDRDARPTVDPAAVYGGGGLTPLGSTADCMSYKGYGLGAAVEILTGLLSGTNWALRLEKGNSQAAQFFLAMQIEAFADRDDFLRGMSDMVDTLMSAEPADGADRVLFPGQREFETRADRERNGVPLDRELLDRLDRFADRLGIARIARD
ncbi:MAG TPA: Ldh family oxidoreductase [Candidatus Binataceae bacterium]|nr:Ldh family oxidoreductase [Candidatus Binataceae bacterium]